MGQQAPIRVTLILFFCILLIPVWAAAQEMGEGIRFGAFSLHPSLYTAMRYNDNVFFLPNNYRPENDRSIPQGIESDFVWNVVPEISFDLKVPSFSGKLDYRYYNDTYLGYDDPDKNHHRLNGSNHTFSGLADYNAPFGLMLGASESYGIIQTYETTDQFVDFQKGDQTHNDARGWLGYHYGPENNIYFRGTYTNLIDKYKTVPEFNKMSQYADGNLSMKFFPRTAVVAQGGYGMIRHEDITDADADLWWAQGGVQGQITTVLFLTVLGGWTQATYQTFDSFSGWIGNAELAALFGNETKLAIGYRRLLRDAVDTNFYTSHEGYLNFSRLWASRLTTSLFADYQNNDFSEPLARHEDFIQGEIDLNYQFVYWLFIGGGYRLEELLFDDGTIKTTTVRNIGTVHLQAQF